MQRHLAVVGRVDEQRLGVAPGQFLGVGRPHPHRDLGGWVGGGGGMEDGGWGMKFS